MKLHDQKENYPEGEANFQDKDNAISSSVNHSFTNNSEPDYGDDLVNKEFDNENLDNENLGKTGQNQNEIGNEQFDSEGLDNEFDNEGLDENYDDEDLGDFDGDDHRDLGNGPKVDGNPNH